MSKIIGIPTELQKAFPKLYERAGQLYNLEGDINQIECTCILDSFRLLEEILSFEQGKCDFTKTYDLMELTELIEGINSGLKGRLKYLREKAERTIKE